MISLTRPNLAGGGKEGLEGVQVGDRRATCRAVSRRQPYSTRRQAAKDLLVAELMANGNGAAVDRAVHPCRYWHVTGGLYKDP
eukprot:4594348-Pyramimonas_sp.AAC.2